MLESIHAGSLGQRLQNFTGIHGIDVHNIVIKRIKLKVHWFLYCGSLSVLLNLNQVWTRDYCNIFYRISIRNKYIIFLSQSTNRPWSDLRLISQSHCSIFRFIFHWYKGKFRSIFFSWHSTRNSSLPSPRPPSFYDWVLLRKRQVGPTTDAERRWIHDTRYMGCTVSFVIVLFRR